MSAGIATAAIDQGSEVTLEAGVCNIETTVGGVDCCISRDARRVHAIKGICAGLDAAEKIVGFGNPQKVARAILGELRTHPRNDCSQIFLLQCAANTETIEDLTVNVHLSQGARGMSAKILVLRSLHNAPELLVGLSDALISETLMDRQALTGPFMGTFKGFFLIETRVKQRGQLIEGEHDV